MSLRVPEYVLVCEQKNCISKSLPNAVMNLVYPQIQSTSAMPRDSCTSMIFWPADKIAFWMHIPCGQHFFGSYLCEYKKDRLYHMDSSFLHPKSNIELRCPNGWFYMYNECYRFEHNTGDCGRKHSIRYCQQIGGVIPSFSENTAKIWLRLVLNNIAHDYDLMYKAAKLMNIQSADRSGLDVAWQSAKHYGIELLPKFAPEARSLYQLMAVLYGKVPDHTFWMDVNSTLFKSPYITANGNKFFIFDKDLRPHNLLCSIVCQRYPKYTENVCPDHIQTCVDMSCSSAFGECSGRSNDHQYDDYGGKINQSIFQYIAKYDKNIPFYKICGLLHYPCDNKCLVVSSLCDNINDCDDGTDEEYCSITHCMTGQVPCDNTTRCISKLRICDGHMDCDDASDESSCTSSSSCKGKWCPSLQICAPSTLAGWLYSRCFRSLPDPPSGTNKSALMNTFKCNDHDDDLYASEEFCVFFRHKWTKPCQFSTNLIGCEFFECPHLFKCHKSYCIPISHVCDGRIDCLTGEDEQLCNNISCPGMFKCRGEERCILQSSVCDDKYDCKVTADDEIMCHKCPHDCQCQPYTMMCNLTTSSPLQLFDDTRGMHLNCLKIINFTHIFAQMFNLKYISFSNCTFEIHFNCKLSKNVPITYIIFMKNNLQIITELALCPFTNLLILDLSDNLIKLIFQSSFQVIKSITIIFLNDNLLEFLPASLFHNLDNLKLLTLHNNRLIVIQPGTFTSIFRLKLITVGKGTFCCMLSENVICRIYNTSQDVCYRFNLVHIYASAWLLVLTLSVYLRWIYISLFNQNCDPKLKMNHALAQNMTFSGFVTTMYLVIPLILNSQLLERHYEHTQTFKSNIACFALALIHFVGFQSWFLFAVALAIFRALSCHSPFLILKHNRIAWAHLICCVIWSMSCLIGGYILQTNLFYSNTKYIVLNELCSFFDSNYYLNEIVYANTSILCGTIASYIALYAIVKRKRMNNPLISTEKNTFLLLKLVMNVSVYILSWSILITFLCLKYFVKFTLSDVTFTLVIMLVLLPSPCFTTLIHISQTDKVKKKFICQNKNPRL